MKIIRHLRSFFSYLLAFCGIPLVLATLLGMNELAALLVRGSHISVSPLYTGGGIARELDHGSWKTRIHEPVFEALLGKPSQGFVQVDWIPKGKLPARISEDLDLDGDGRPDCSVVWERFTGEPSIKVLSPSVLALVEHYELARSYSLRIGLSARK